MEILLSFVGTNDALKPDSGDNGPIISLLQHYPVRFDTVHLFYTVKPADNKNFKEVAESVEERIRAGQLASAVVLHEFPIQNPTDHNEIYPKLLEKCESLRKDGAKFTAAVTSGTPAILVCWVLLGESGDFDIQLLRANDKKHISPGENLWTKIKLEINLPKIISLNKDVTKLLSEITITVTETREGIKQPTLKIGDIEVEFSKKEYCCYRYFLEKAKKNKAFGEQIVKNNAKKERLANVKFYQEILHIYKRDFGVSAYKELIDEEAKNTGYRFLLDRAGKRVYPEPSKVNKELDGKTLRLWVHRVNERIADTLKNAVKSAKLQADVKDVWLKYCKLVKQGNVSNYGVEMPAEKIKLK